MKAQYFQQDGHSSHPPPSTKSHPHVSPAHPTLSHSLSYLRTVAFNFKVRVGSSLVTFGFCLNLEPTANHTGELLMDKVVVIGMSTK